MFHSRHHQREQRVYLARFPVQRVRARRLSASTFASCPVKQLQSRRASPTRVTAANRSEVRARPELRPLPSLRFLDRAVGLSKCVRQPFRPSRQRQFRRFRLRFHRRLREGAVNHVRATCTRNQNHRVPTPHRGARRPRSPRAHPRRPRLQHQSPARIATPGAGNSRTPRASRTRTRARRRRAHRARLVSLLVSARSTASIRPSRVDARARARVSTRVFVFRIEHSFQSWTEKPPQYVRGGGTRRLRG